MKIDPNADPRFAVTEYVVEATTHEWHEIWYRWSAVLGVDFVQDSLLARGDIDGPVERAMTAQVSWSLVAGACVAFVDLTSGWVWDRRIAQAWLSASFPCLHGPDGWRSRHSDAGNFHNVIARIGRTRPVAMRDYGEVCDAIGRVPVRFELPDR